MSTLAAPKPLDGIGEVAGRYDAFLLDQFGVLHDGVAPYPGAVEALLRLTGAGKQVVIVSNSGKRAAPNEARLEQLGFPRAAWSRLLSSGELAWTLLKARGLAGKCLLIARDGDRSAIDGLPIALTNSGEDCDLVLIAGSEGDGRSLDDYAAVLESAARRGIPAYCTNPDREMLTPGGLRFGAGQIAELYECMGGTVTWIGKPHPAIYAAVRESLGVTDPSRILCIGDSIEHDIVGASRAGLASCLIRGGIHDGSEAAELARLFDRFGAAPEFVADRFAW